MGTKRIYVWLSHAKSRKSFDDDTRLYGIYRDGGKVSLYIEKEMVGWFLPVSE